jgi:hypothetical protein
MPWRGFWCDPMDDRCHELRRLPSPIFEQQDLPGRAARTGIVRQFLLVSRLRGEHLGTSSTSKLYYTGSVGGTARHSGARSVAFGHRFRFTMARLWVCACGWCLRRRQHYGPLLGNTLMGTELLKCRRLQVSKRSWMNFVAPAIMRLFRATGWTASIGKARSRYRQIRLSVIG